MATPTTFRQPAYLVGSQHEPRHRVRCAIHGFIHFSDAERKIIDRGLFRRLRLIRQLALTELLYPGATHTRFEHSLGVMEMATRMFDRLAAENGALMEEVFRQAAPLAEDTLARARQACRLAALLHDVGHCCFSHAAEEVLHKESGHEALTETLLRGEGDTPYFGEQLEGDFFPGAADLVADIIRPRPEAPPQYRLIRDIVSGQIDADRTDYLLRDSHHCGVDYGRFDHRRLIECLTVWQDEGSGEPLMAVRRDGVQSFESLILARYQMNTQVYYHRVRRIYDRYLIEYFRTLDRTLFDSTEKLLAWNDVTALARLIEDARDASAPGHRWARRIVERDHHRQVFALDEKDGVASVRKARKMLEAIRTEFTDVEFLDDFPDKLVSIHKIETDEDQEQGRIDFPLIDQGKRTSLGERSHLINKMPTGFRIGYVFADVTDAKERAKVSERCRQLYNQQN